VSGYVASTVKIGIDATLKRGLVRGLTRDTETGGRLATYGRITYTPAAVNELDILAATLTAGLGASTFNVNDPGVALTDLNTGTNADNVNVNKLSGQLILEGNAAGGSITLNGPLVLNAQTTMAIARTTVGSSFAIVDNRTPVAVTGQFQTANGTPMPDGTTFMAGGITLQIHYKGSDGDADTGDAANQDAVLTHLNTPPSVSNLFFQPVENVASTLSAEIDDPDAMDTLAVTVNWGDGQSSTFTLPAGKTAFTATHTYPEEIKAPFPVTVSAYDGHGEPPTTASIETPVADAGIVITSVGNATIGVRSAPFPIEGAAFTGQVATFTDYGSDGTTQDYAATITWGDGKTSAGTIIGFGDKLFAVTGSHTYAEEGVYRKFKVQVTDVGGAARSGTGPETVLNAPLNIVVPNLTAQEHSTFSGVVAHFTDPGTDGSSFDYHAYVEWGSASQTSAGFVVADGKGGFNVMTTYTFGPATGAPFVVTVLVDDHGTQNFGTGQVQLTALPITTSFVPVSAVDGQSFTGTVATFTDASAGSSKAAPGYFMVTIAWGDGAPTPATIKRASPGAPFRVIGSHTYSATGDFPVTVTIHDRDGTSALAQGTAHVVLAPGQVPDFVLDSQGVLTISGDLSAAANNDTFGVAVSASGGVTAMLDSRSAPFAPAVVKAIVIDCGGGNNTINLDDTPQGVPVTVNLGAGTNTVNLAPASKSLASLGGTITVNHHGGIDSLTANDQADANNTVWTVGSTGLTWEASTGGGVITGPPIVLTVNYTNMAAVTLDGGSGANTFHIGIASGSRAPSAATTLNGGSGTNTLTGPDTDNVWQIVGANVGTLDSAVSFTSVQNLAGGAGNNQFQFHDSGSLGGTVAGGGGTNTLDYSGYHGDVTVSLPLGTASLIGKGIANIQNVIGSAGNDLLVGDANANVLTGGTGRNVIIGGAGSDTLDATASKDDNILIGGTTQWDMNLTALQAIAQVWNDTTQSFDQRVQALQNGVVIGGQTYVLNRTTVQPDSSPDALNGGGGRNWFFVDFDDTINGGKGAGSSDLVTNVGQVT
jgi:hypothetical protein